MIIEAIKLGLFQFFDWRFLVLFLLLAIVPIVFIIALKFHLGFPLHRLLFFPILLSVAFPFFIGDGGFILGSELSELFGFLFWKLALVAIGMTLIATFIPPVNAFLSPILGTIPFCAGVFAIWCFFDKVFEIAGMDHVFSKIVIFPSIWALFVFLLTGIFLGFLVPVFIFFSISWLASKDIHPIFSKIDEFVTPLSQVVVMFLALDQLIFILPLLMVGQYAKLNLENILPAPPMAIFMEKNIGVTNEKKTVFGKKQSRPNPNLDDSKTDSNSRHPSRPVTASSEMAALSVKTTDRASKDKDIDFKSSRKINNLRNYVEVATPITLDDTFAEALRYFTADGVVLDQKRASSLFLKGAEAGHARSQFMLGVCYERGEGIEQNDRAAFYWYEKSAEQGNMNAQTNLSLLYFRGKGVQESKEKGVYWLKKVAEQGDPISQTALGLCYQRGFGIRRDYEAAVFWYRQAALQGNAEAQCALGLRYAHGQGVEQDIVMACAWTLFAVEGGSERAKPILDSMLKNNMTSERMQRLKIVVLELKEEIERVKQ